MWLNNYSADGGPSLSIAYHNYWKRKQLIDESPPKFPAIPYWIGNDLCTSEQKIFEFLMKGKSTLDYGAGSLRVQKKFQSAGYSGDYQTLDISDEFEYDYQNLKDVQRTFDTILFLDVIEHLTLDLGLQLLCELLKKLNPGGHLVLQTPNARSIRNQKATDITHLHIYNLKDLWAYTTAQGFKTQGWRLYSAPQNPNPLKKLQSFIQKLVITRLLDCDYADNIMLSIKKAP